MNPLIYKGKIPMSPMISRTQSHSPKPSFSNYRPIHCFNQENPMNTKPKISQLTSPKVISYSHTLSSKGNKKVVVVAKEECRDMRSQQMMILCGFGYWVQGFRCFPWLALNFHMAHYLNLHPSTLQLVQNTGNLPMVAKPLYGILSDALYIGGAHRIPYISIGVLLQVLSWGSLALIPVAGKALPILMACVLFSNLGASITEVAKDALVAEYGVKNKMAGLQSYAFMALACGGILGNLLGGYSLLRLPPRSMCLVFAGFLSLQLTISIATREESLGLEKPINQSLMSKPVLRTFKEQYSDLVVAISEENISRPLIWIVASICLVPILSGSVFCYQTQCLNLNPSIIGMSRVTSQIILLSATVLYGRFWRNVPLRKLIGMVQSLYATSLFLDLALVNQLNLKFGISNEIFTLCFSGITEAIAQFKLLPFQMLIASLAPPGCEGSLMSFMASAVCLSSIVGGFLGVGLASILGITLDNYSNLSLGIIIQFIAALVSLQWIYYVPVSQPSSEQGWKKGRIQRTRKSGRMMFNSVDEYRRERRSGYRNKRLLQE
ncbi:hypothetical protein ACET3Z_025585 [Daucus carota]